MEFGQYQISRTHAPPGMDRHMDETKQNPPLKLTDAAHRLKLSIDDLIKHGIDGSLQICVWFSGVVGIMFAPADDDKFDETIFKRPIAADPLDDDVSNYHTYLVPTLFRVLENDLARLYSEKSKTGTTDDANVKINLFYMNNETNSADPSKCDGEKGGNKNQKNKDDATVWELLGPPYYRIEKDGYEGSAYIKISYDDLWVTESEFKRFSKTRHKGLKINDENDDTSEVVVSKPKAKKNGSPNLSKPPCNPPEPPTPLCLPEKPISNSTDPNRLIRLPEVLGIIHVSRSTWWNWVKEGKAPASIRRGSCTFWRYSEVIALATEEVQPDKQ